jgi:hypothetical protein
VDVIRLLNDHEQAWKDYRREDYAREVGQIRAQLTAVTAERDIARSLLTGSERETQTRIAELEAKCETMENEFETMEVGLCALSRDWRETEFPYFMQCADELERAIAREKEGGG